MAAAADAGSHDLMSIGQHCAFPDCHQLDFLPFTCSCGQVFCLSHRTAAAHSCPLAGAACKQVIVCPICAKGVELGPNDDPNITFDRHQREGCDPANYARVHKKPRCPVAGCKQRLSTINTYECRDCRQAVCLKHRLGADHACPGPSRAPATAAAAAGQRASAALAAAAAAGRSLGSRASTLVSDLRSAAAGAGAGAGSTARQQQAPPRTQQQQQQQQRRRQQPPADPANTLHGSAARRQRMLQEQGAERCPQCGAAFASVQELILHVDAAHANSNSSAPPAPAATHQQQQQGGGCGARVQQREVFQCPSCSLQFNDAVLLLSHSERCGKGQDSCVLN